MIRFFKSRRPGPTDLTWEEKNSADYRYHSEDIDKPETPNKQKYESKQKQQKAE